jgi:serine/threonine-protein kinase
MAPELWEGEAPGIASDVYAAAVLLAECVAGEPPFQGGVIAVRAQHLAAPPAGPDLPPSLARLVAAGMAKSPDERYPTAAGFAADVAATGDMLGGLRWETHGRRLLAGAVAAALMPEPVAVLPDPPRRVIGRSALGRLVRAGLVVVVVGGAVVGATWWLDRDGVSPATGTSHPSGPPGAAQILGRPAAPGGTGAATPATPAMTPGPGADAGP